MTVESEREHQAGGRASGHSLQATALAKDRTRKAFRRRGLSLGLPKWKFRNHRNGWYSDPRCPSWRLFSWPRLIDLLGLERVWKEGSLRNLSVSE
jgi:hypothetical protein